MITVKTSKPLPHLGGGDAENAFPDCVQTAGAINDDVIAPVATCESEVLLCQRRLKAPAAIGTFEAIENRLADLMNIDAEPPRLSILRAGRRVFDRVGPVVRY